MANKHMNDIHKKLLKKYHTLCSLLNLSQEDKEAILTRYKVASSCDLDSGALLSLCNKLSEMVENRAAGADMDALRKRLIAAIGAYLRVSGQRDKDNIEDIKSIACRAAGVKNFGSISRERLRSLYGAFVMKRKDIERLREIQKDIYN